MASPAVKTSPKQKVYTDKSRAYNMVKAAGTVVVEGEEALTPYPHTTTLKQKRKGAVEHD